MYTLGDIPRNSAIRFPDREAVVFENTRLTYKQLNERVNRFANALTNKGYKKGDRLAVLSENTHKYLEIYFAASKIGMSVTPLNIRLSIAEIERITVDSEAKVFLVGDGYESFASELRKNLKNINDWISIDNEIVGYLNYEEMVLASSLDEPGVLVGEDEMAILMYTGGTTGLPKGVMMSHRGLMTAFLGQIIEMEFTSKDATCFILPLFHVAFWPVMTILLAGGKIVIMRKPEIPKIAKLISKERCTHVLAVPTVYSWILELPDIDAYDLSSLRLINYGGSPMPADLLKKCISKFGYILMQVYGSTEVPGVTLLRGRDHVIEAERSKLMSVGSKNICADEIRVVDEEDNPVMPGKIGEIVVRGKTAMMGYWKNPELTAKTMRNGWFHMGDMGYLDDDGYLVLVDRKSDMIITGGENVYPKETEEILYMHPSVMECVVVSAPSEKWGEQVQAAVVLKSGMSTTEKELIAHCKKHLAGYKCPKKIEFWDVLPKTAIGKLSRRDVKEKYWQGRDRLIG